MNKMARLGMTGSEEDPFVHNFGKMASVLVAAALLWATVPASADSRAGLVVAPMRTLQQSRWVPEGSARPRHVIYVFMDPNCPYCHALWLALKPYYEQGLQVRNILVGVISASSPGKTAAIWDAADPAAALRGNEDRWGQGPDRGGGIQPLAHPGARDLAELQSNESLMPRFGIRGTPGLVFASTQGKVYVLPGMPPKSDLGRIVRMATAPRGGRLALHRGRHSTALLTKR